MELQDWPEEYGPYALGYKPLFESCRLELLTNKLSWPIANEVTQEEQSNDKVGSIVNPTPTKWKRRKVSVVRDFPLILEAHNP